MFPPYAIEDNIENKTELNVVLNESVIKYIILCIMFKFY
jgi:hypothetical protein